MLQYCLCSRTGGRWGAEVRAVAGCCGLSCLEITSVSWREPRGWRGGSAGSAHAERLLGESLCTALGWSTVVIVRALFFAPNKLFLQIKNEKSSSSHSSFYVMRFAERRQRKGLQLDGGCCGCRGSSWGGAGATRGRDRIARGCQSPKCTRAGCRVSP